MVIFSKNLFRKLSYLLSLNKEKLQIRFINFSKSFEFLMNYFQIQNVNICIDLENNNTTFENTFKKIFKPNLYLKRSDIVGVKAERSKNSYDSIDFIFIDSTQSLVEFRYVIFKSNFIIIKINNFKDTKNKELEKYFSFFNENNFQLFVTGKNDIYSITKIKTVYGLPKTILLIAIKKDKLFVLKDYQKNYKKFVLRDNFN